MAKKKINVQGLEIKIEPTNENDYISLTDIAKQSNAKRPEVVIQRWMKNNSTIRYLYLWEKIHNTDLNHTQMSVVYEELLDNMKAISPKRWIELTNAKGMFSRTGRGGGTYAHSDIAINFLYWLSPEFQIYFIKEFQRLKEEEANQKQIEWTVQKITDNLDEARNLIEKLSFRKKLK